LPEEAPVADLYIYTTPAEARVALALDDGRTIAGIPGEANGRADAHRLELPAGVNGQGAVLTVAADGYVTFSNRGILNPDRPCFELDDVRLVAEGVAPVPPEPPRPPDPYADPAAIIQAVYEQGNYNLATAAGCGLFTEAACEALHREMSILWGHIKKNPGQNQFNGHAVDAVMLLAAAGTTVSGGYDIVQDSVSINAAPCFHYAGPADGELWYWPPEPLEAPEGGFNAEAPRRDRLQ
jgi:hypothetical protein